MQQRPKLKPRVTLRHESDLESAAAFTPKVYLQHRREIQITLPPSRKGAIDAIDITVTEGDWEHTYVYFGLSTKGGHPDCPNEILAIDPVAVRCDQIDRLIEALQLAVVEMDKIGLRTPRKLPTQRTA